MSKPLVVSIPHRLGKEEALRRLQSGLHGAAASFGHLFAIDEANWAGDHLQFRVHSLGQTVNGTIDVAEDYVRLEVLLPWLLAMLAEALLPAIRKEGALLLEKK
jgi:Putative polyhydroxyalkanoic acid system protein (PHA_gran_rgn)